MRHVAIGVILSVVLLGQAHGSDVPEQLKVSVSWGHEATSSAPYFLRLAPNGFEVTKPKPMQLEPTDGFKDGAWQGAAGASDVDGCEFILVYPKQPPNRQRKEHVIWTHLLREGDPEAANRLRQDPAFDPDLLVLTLQMNSEGTRGFSVAVDQLICNRAIWAPEMDVFLTAGEPLVSFEDHKKSLEPFKGQRVLNRVRREPEATYEQFISLWADMGDPRNDHPNHIVGLTWDSAIHKFGIDRLAGVRSDLGNPGQFRFAFDLSGFTWKGQKLDDGLPIMTTALEKDGIAIEIEQFAYPLNGPPPERRGDIPMVLLQKVKLTESRGEPRMLSLPLNHLRQFPKAQEVVLAAQRIAGNILLEDSKSHRVLLTIEGTDADVKLLESTEKRDDRAEVIHRNVNVEVPLDLAALGSREFIVKLPSPVVEPGDCERLLNLGYAVARQSTRRFWLDFLSRGAQFRVPEKVVNDLFRANLWHALRLPRRHGGREPNVRIDLPYSNFAYEQNGVPWPVNQAVYVDYMLYDLRGYHDLSLEELLTIYGSNQQQDGRIVGFANWGVYTPAMVYSSAKHCLLSGSRHDLEQLLSPTLKAADGCLAEMKKASEVEGPGKGLVLAPLNDLTHEARAWSFNQAYFYAGFDVLGRLLRQIGHPRAEEFRGAARAMHEATDRGFAQACIRSPLVQLRDHTWIPYVPADALTPRRLIEVWYPTDVDTGPLHLPRLKALDPSGPLATYLLHDHEDNLYFKGWGMANEPVYNPQATVYLLRDDPKGASRAFYSYMACAFSHTVLEPVEHRWGWGQFFGPPSTDGAWFELYRNMLIQERDDDTVLLFAATPRRWLEDGKRVEVERAPTYYGTLSATVESRANNGRITAEIRPSGPRQPKALLVRFRHPQATPMRSVSVNGQSWTDFDVEKEWVRINNPTAQRYLIEVNY